MARTLIAIAAFGCVVLGLARTLPAWVEHAEAREAYERLGARVGTPNYDAERSDRAYALAREAHGRTGTGALALTLGLLLFGMLAPTHPALGEPLGPGKSALAIVLDALVIVGALALSFLDDAESATLHALACAGPPLVLGGHLVGLAHGASFGLGVLGAGVDHCSYVRALVATALTPLALLALPLALFGKDPAVHLRWAGLRGCDRSPNEPPPRDSRSSMP